MQEPCCRNFDKPALEHENGCRTKLSFYGGDPDWDRSVEHERDGTWYEWSTTCGGTWAFKQQAPCPRCGKYGYVGHPCLGTAGFDCWKNYGDR